MRPTIEEYVNTIYPKHHNKSKIALIIGATKSQLDYAISSDTMKFELKQKLIRLSLKCKKLEQNDGTK